jgi:hypothetical protein
MTPTRFPTGSFCQACGVQRPVQTVLGVTDRELCWPCRWDRLRAYLARRPRPSSKQAGEPPAPRPAGPASEAPGPPRGRAPTDAEIATEIRP